MIRLFRPAACCTLAVAALLLAVPARAQMAPVQYWIPGGPFGFGGITESFSESAPDDDGFRKGLSFTSFSYPVSSLSSGLAWSGLRGYTFNHPAGLTSEGSQYGYSFKGIGDTPVTLFGGTQSLRTNTDVFTSLVTPGFASGHTLATAVHAGIEFRPMPNVSLSLSAGFVQPAPTVDTDLRSQLINSYRR